MLLLLLHRCVFDVVTISWILFLATNCIERKGHVSDDFELGEPMNTVRSYTARAEASDATKHPQFVSQRAVLLLDASRYGC
jgi:hypothetical protein